MSIAEISFGEILQALREYKKLSPEELAEGICTVEDLQLFEKEKKYPALDQLYELAEKLNVEVNYFFHYASSSTFNYVTAVFELIKKYKRERNYQAIFDIIKRERQNPIFKHISHKQFLMWHEGICIYYLSKDVYNSVNTLYTAIDLTNPDRTNLAEREIEILTSIAIIRFEEEEFAAAYEIFEMALKNLESLPHILDPKAKLRILYGLSQTLSAREEYDNSLKYSNQGIKDCINNELLYLFGEFYYQSGENYIKIDKVDKGIEYINKSKEIFLLQNNERFVKLVEVELEKLLEKC